ncbi:MAG: glucoamylase family protein, partial [Anaerolineae bacterium]
MGDRQQKSSRTPQQGASRDDQLDRLARQLAEHHTTCRLDSKIDLLARLPDYAATLREAYRVFSRISEQREALSGPAEWMLDNFHVVQKAIRQIREDMPQSYYRQLPKLENSPLEGRPRTYALAREMVQHYEAQLDLDRVVRFVRAYQGITPLAMGELWALPTMLRLVLLEALVQTLARVTELALSDDVRRADLVPVAEHVPDDAWVANAISSLRMLGNQDWKRFFERVSPVEEILRSDPVEVYGRMDFETRDRYRGVVEELALATERSEADVARAAVRLAEAHAEPEMADAPLYEIPRSAHVGFYLVDRGCSLLENRVGYELAWGERLRRWILDRATLVYLGSIALITCLVLLAAVGYARSVGATALQAVITALLALVPAAAVGVNLVNLVVTRTVSPRVLPKLDFSAGVPDECQTIVAVPSMLTSDEEVVSLLQQIELHYLSNPDPNLRFALLTDFADAPQEHMPGDEDLLEQARAGIKRLNRKHTRGSSQLFYLFHRRRLWNPSEEAWMGWERKRGKLMEFNRLLLGGGETTYSVKLGDPGTLSDIRYVITLDADTVLPREGALRLVATMAHPLNRAEFDAEGERVVAGHTVLQPRAEVKPAQANRSWFTRIFAGDVGLDLYTRAVSDVYQDLFGEGIYVGKGIYDLEAFERSLRGRVPENTLLSHDLFEGIHGRAGLLTDVVIFEDYPPSYLAFAHRRHRWVRGDWQLLPWLFPRVPHAEQGSVPNPLSALDRWKAVDNLRRSLWPPALLALLVVGWLWLPGSPLVWTLATLFVSAVPLVAGFVGGLVRRFRSSVPRGPMPSARSEALRWLLSLVFLPYESLLMFDAIATTLIRLVISRKRLLQWTTAAHTIRLFGRKSKVGLLWRRMGGAPLLALTLGMLIGLLDIPALPIAAPLLLAWLLSPQVAVWISQPISRERGDLTPDQRIHMRRLARQTWLFFERFVGPEDHWLPPDHFQEDPRGLVAHRTSPTNIGLLLLSTLTAFELGYIDPMNLALRLRSTLNTLDELERYRGHFLNWYDTRSLAPLTPRYVSTVDSGNLAACLLTLKQRVDELGHLELLGWQRWEGLRDALGVLSEVLTRIDGREMQATVDALRQHMAEVRRYLSVARETPDRRASLLLELVEGEIGEAFDRLLGELIQVGASQLDAATLQDLRLWAERVHHHLRNMREELDMTLPWLLHFEHAPELFTRAEADGPIATAWQALQDAFPARVCLDEVPRLCRTGHRRLLALQQALDDAAELLDEETDPRRADRLDAARDWCDDLDQVLESARMTTRGLRIGLQGLSEHAQDLFQSMEFGFLFDDQREVFHLGYRVEAEQLDANHYDLLASEARIASLVAIAKGDVPRSHWLHLARPLSQVDGIRALLSWNGSMFEYLMPGLLMRSYEGTLLDQTNQAVVRRQIEYARQRDVPCWGISESGYYRFDAQMNYQYRGFGVPGLGRKRGLGEDLVIAPYASLLALPVDPQAVVENVERLRDEEMLGHYGFYEAVDYTGSRLPLGEERAIVRSYMAHHQGMIVVALANRLRDQAMVRCFHAAPQVRSVELLLQERVPYDVPTEQVPEAMVEVKRPKDSTVSLEPWGVLVDTPLPQVHFLSNGSYSVLITNAGGGYSAYTPRPSETGETIALTRWRTDTTRDAWGTWLYVQDRESGDLWSATRQPVGETPVAESVRFWPSRAEFRRRDHDVSLHTELVVAPEDPVEIRRLALTNHSGRTRRLRVTSYGEVVLAPQSTDRRHPAFNKMFIESEYLPGINALVFQRRPRASGEAPLSMVHLLAVEPGEETTGAHEGDRTRFLGRGQTNRCPVVREAGGELSGTTGATLDPVMVLQQEIELPPHATARVAFVTLAAGERSEALALARRYQDWHRIGRSFDQARSQGRIDLHNLNLGTEDVARFQRLLSALLYPHQALRARAATLKANTRGQAGLWPYAISGDYPILLVRIDSREDVALVRELLRAHIYWRKRQLKIDLVILNERDMGYAEELSDDFNQLVTQMDSDAWLNRRGGVFLLRAGQIDEAGLTLLQAAARVVLDAGAGTLDQQLQRLFQRPSRLPQFFPTPPSEGEDRPVSPVARPEDLQFDNGLGGFSPDGREYVIYLDPHQRTPAPWINVVANPDFGFLVSEVGSGFTWSENSGENRLTPWHNDPVSDPPAEVLYLRDEETAQIWSPTPAPVGADTPYLVRHGAGYSTFEHNSHGLKHRLQLFAVPDAPVKVMRLRLENTWDRVRRITATLYAEWVLGTHRDQMQQHVVSEYHAESDTLLARNAYNAEFGQRVAFVAASKELHGLAVDRTEFLGRMGDLSCPAALGRVGLSGTVEPGVDPCAAAQIHLDLQAGEVREVHFLLGQGVDRHEALQLAEEYRHPEATESAWREVTGFWDDLLGAVTVRTPDRAMDLMLNRWLPYQALSCRLWARSALYQSSGAYGFRDQLQDVLSLLNVAPELAREHILRAASHQFVAGDVLHWWHPPTGRGVRTRISDDLLWLPYVTAAYVEATGDVGILDQEVPFRTGEPLEAGEEERYDHYDTTEEAFTLYEHCCRALERGTTAGPHGLPLMGAGDWNDGMNRVGVEGRGESVWLGWFLYAGLTRFAALSVRRGEDDRADRFQQQAEALREALREHAWDGAWYRRAYYDDGTPLGSARNEECQIDSIAQSWAVLSGAGDEERVAEAMASVAERLVCPEDR